MSLYNSDELVPPAWINQKFLEDVLRKYENDEHVELVGFDMTPACMKGDHYASIMFRCKVHYRLTKDGSADKHRSMIIKTLPIEECVKREMLMESSVFETEIDMYTKTLPRIEKILADCGEPTKLAPEILYHSLEPYKVLILEDLCESGYDTMRGRFPTEDEIKFVYRKLAKLHAVSYMLGHSEEHELVTKYREGFMNLSGILKDLMSVNLKNFVEMLSSFEEFSVYHEKVKAMHGDIEQACKDLFQAYTLNNGQGDIFVLNHGDFHMKNIMFKFNQENQMDDMIMIDYQISCYAPSTIDLTYSQFVMLRPDLRMRRHEIMQYYFTEFIRILKKINYQGELPKYSQFQISGLKYRHYVVFMLAVLYPMVVEFFTKSVEEIKDVDTSKLVENPNQNVDMFYSPEYVEEIRKFMPVLLSEGYLD